MKYSSLRAKTSDRTEHFYTILVNIEYNCASTQVNGVNRGTFFLPIDFLFFLFLFSVLKKKKEKKCTYSTSFKE